MRIVSSQENGTTRDSRYATQPSNAATSVDPFEHRCDDRCTFLGTGAIAQVEAPNNRYTYHSSSDIRRPSRVHILKPALVALGRLAKTTPVELMYLLLRVCARIDMMLHWHMSTSLDCARMHTRGLGPHCNDRGARLEALS